MTKKCENPECQVTWEDNTSPIEYCSVECAVHSRTFSIQTGLIINNLKEQNLGA